MRGINRFLKAFALLMLISASALSGQEQLQVANADYIIKKNIFSVEDGLTSREVKCAVMDIDGFMWFGTSMGLNRYDGKHFKQFTKEIHGLKSNLIVGLSITHNNKLIIHFGLEDGKEIIPISRGGFQVMDLTTFTLQTLEQAFPKLPFPASEIWDIQNDDKQNIVIARAAPYEIWLYSNKTGYTKVGALNNLNNKSTHHARNFMNVVNSYMKIQKDFIELKLRFKNDTKKYILRSGQCFEVEIGSLNTLFTHVNKANELVEYINKRSFGETFYSKENGYYTLNSQGVFKPNETLQTLPIKSDHEWLFTPSNAAGEFVCSNSDFGLCLFNGNSYLEILDKNELFDFSNIVTYKFYKDLMGNYWICTSIGVIQLTINKCLFKNYFTKSEIGSADNNQVRGIYAFPLNKSKTKDTIYATVWKNVMTSPNIKINNDEIWESLLTIENHSNALYIGTGSNLLIINKTNLKIERVNFAYSIDAWALNSVNDSLLLMGSGNTEGPGIYIFNSNKKTLNPIKKTTNKIPNPHMVYRLIKTMKKGIVALAENGIFRLDNQLAIVEYWGPLASKDHQIDIQEFYDLHEDKQGMCWLATANQGLFCWDWNSTSSDKPKLKHYTQDNGLPSMRLYRIEEDDRKNLWISTYNGLLRFNTNDFSTYTFTTQDGISNNEFNRISSFKSANGNLYFGGVNGINAFNPDSLNKTYSIKNYPFRIIELNKFSNNENKLINCLSDWNTKQAIELDYSDKFLAVEFGLLDYLKRPHRYAYIIEGIDKDWNYTNDGSLRISQLAYGNYTLRIKAQLENGLWNKNEINLQINVSKPFYLRTSFIISCLIGLIIIILLINYFRQYRMKIQNEKLEKLVSIRTDKLNSALHDKDLLLKEIHHRVKNNLQIVSDLLQLQKDGIPNDSSSEILSDGQSRVISMALIHQNLYNNEDLSTVRFDVFLKAIIDQIMELFSINNRKIKANLSIDDIQLDIDTAIPLALISNELITNAYKYASNSHNVVTIDIGLKEIEKGNYILTFKDNGPGLPEKINTTKSSTLGMQLIKGLAQQLSGTVEYTFNSGSLFTIKFKDSKTRELE